jgi:hypothetical protein
MVMPKPPGSDVHSGVPVSRAGRCRGVQGLDVPPRPGATQWPPGPKKTSPTWRDVKATLADFDRAGLLGVVQDLYASSKDTQAFLHARLGLGVDLLRPYRDIIDRWLWPDIIKNQSTSVSTARKAIADYKKATGQPEGLAELMVFFCERAAGFSNEVGLQDDGYAGALVRMFEGSVSGRAIEAG